MKTLLERLSPELLLAIEKEAKKYPSMMGSLKNELLTNYSYMDMTIANGYRLTDLTESRVFGLLELSKCFNNEK